jgi:hypothetical protein
LIVANVYCLKSIVNITIIKEEGREIRERFSSLELIAQVQSGCIEDCVYSRDDESDAEYIQF